jgi:hypothetical protein
MPSNSPSLPGRDQPDKRREHQRQVHTGDHTAWAPAYWASTTHMPAGRVPQCFDNNQPMPPKSTPRNKAAAWRRWAGVGLRSAHLAAVSWLAVALYGVPAQQHVAGLLLLVSGAALLAIELADRRVRLAEAAGAIVLIKLVLAGAMLLWPEAALWLFWGLLLVSSASSHMPRDWRHWPSKL